MEGVWKQVNKIDSTEQSPKRSEKKRKKLKKNIWEKWSLALYYLISEKEYMQCIQLKLIVNPIYLDNLIALVSLFIVCKHNQNNQQTKRIAAVNEVAAPFDKLLGAIQCKQCYIIDSNNTLVVSIIYQ